MATAIATKGRVTAPAVCRDCGWAGTAVLSKKRRRNSHPAVTGVPCPKCGKHHLRKVG